MASRGSRRLIWLVVVLVVLVGLAVAADRISVAVVEHIAATQLQKSQDLPSRPSVDIDGFPFLTQLAGNDLDEVTVDADGVPIGKDAHGARLQHLHTVLHHVRTSDHFHQLHAATMTATGSTSFGELSKALGAGTLSYSGTGRVAIQESLPVVGSATVSAEPVVKDGALAFDDIRVVKATSIVGAIAQRFTAVFRDVSLPVDAVPFGLRPTAISVTSSGVSFALTGSNVDLTKN